jgi:uncharacterized protein
MSADQILILGLAIGAVAFLYSSVGHAGASGYIAVMTLAGLEPDVIKPTALVLNILVASIATWQFARRGYFSWKLFWPFALLAVPLAFLGGYYQLPADVFKFITGIVLILSAARFLVRPSDDSVKSVPSLKAAIPAGGAIGFLAGLTGTGGGIFLTPLLLMMRWATAKTAASVSALFILLNSAAGLAGNFSSTQNIPKISVPLAISAIAAGFAGSWFGSHRFPHTTIKRLLSVVLLIAGVKLLLDAAT